MLDSSFWDDSDMANELTSELKGIKSVIQSINNLDDHISSNIDLLNEASDDEDELSLLIFDEYKELKRDVDKLEIQTYLNGEYDGLNAIIEIHAGAGGTESCDWANMLFRMYSRYAERRRWKMELLSASDTGVGGYKEVSFLIKGKGAYSRLKYESGVHRVQRIPSTESGGRIHTSTATVAVLPEVETVEVNINPNDLRIDVFRSSGNGGQSVNTTDSAVRITHIPTGEVVSCQDGKSQLKNKEQALKILVARLNDKAIAEQNKDIAAERKSQVGTGDRSERIRTYNFPQGRVSDHRINLTLYKLDSFLDGDIDEMIDALITVDQTEKMASI